MTISEDDEKIKNYLLTDENLDETSELSDKLKTSESMVNSNKLTNSKSKNKKNLKKIPGNKKMKKNSKEKLIDSEDHISDDELNETKSFNSDNDYSNVEFLVVEDENSEKKLVINLELRLKNNIQKKDVLKIDFEICKEIYLDLIKELLK